MRSIKLPSWIERILGLDPVPPPPHVFALDADELHYGSFHRGPQGYIFDAVRGIELMPETFTSGPLGGPVREPHVFEEQVRSFVDSLPGEIHEASLLVPDSWMRLTFTELSELPRQRKAREEVLRWKLKRLVPFRVEELRIDAIELVPLPEQEEPIRLLLGFGIELLMAQIENAFRSAGIFLGRMTNESLALMAGLEAVVAPEQLAATVVVRPNAYTLSMFRDGEPVLYRHKPFTEEMPDEIRMRSVRRDLRLTNSYVREHFPQTPLERVFLVAPAAVEERWMAWIYEELDASAEPLASEHFPLVARWQAEASWMASAPLYGAICLEVA